MCKLTRKKLIVRALLSFLIVGTLYGGSEKVDAQEGIGFSYHNHKPKNQVGEGGYFDLLVKPNDKQTLITEVRNETAETIKLKISINDSKTTGNGVIEYGPSTLKNTNKLVYKLNDLLSGPTEVTLKKGEVKDLEFKLVVPEKGFKGIILGGIELEKITEHVASSEAVSVQNKYAYAFSFSLREDETLLPFQLNSEEVSYLTKNKKEYANLTVTNDVQEIVKGLKLATIITAEGSNEVLVENVSTELKMAPMSVMNYLIEFPDPEPGKYVAKTIATVGKKKFNWENKFEVTEKNKAVGQKELIEKEKKSTNYNGLFIILGTVAVGTGILFVALKLYKK